jgi:hypothetical protein
VNRRAQAALGVLALWLALMCASRDSARAATLRFTVSDRPASRTGSSAQAPPVAPGFLGTSMDYCNITRYMSGTRSGQLLAHLLLALAPHGPVVRIGGNGPDVLCPGGPRPIGVAPAAIASLAARIRGRLILGVNLDAPTVDAVRAEVAALLAALGPGPPYPSIEAFEIGNEPDLQPQWGGTVEPAETGPYFSRYLATFDAWAGVVRAQASDPGVGIAGPSLGRVGLPWLTGANTGNFAAFVDASARANPVTFHAYPLLKEIPCPLPGCPSLPNLLLDGASNGMAVALAPFVGDLPRGRELRVDEMNSVSGGGVAGISNTFASALWALDTMFEFARAGIAGVNFHTFPGARYALYSGPGPHGWLVYPEYYGLLMFARAAPAGAQLLSVRGGPPAGGARPVKVWATRSADGTLRITVINKDVVPHRVVLGGGGVPASRTATLTRLSARGRPSASPSCPAAYARTGLCATGGVRLGGATFGPAAAGGGDSTATGLLGRPAPGTCRRLPACAPQPPGAGIVLTVPAGSAVLVSGVRAPPARRAAG